MSVTERRRSQKAQDLSKILKASLDPEELPRFHDDTPGLRKSLTVVLQRDEALCGKLARVVQGAASFPQVLTEELDEIDRARSIRANLDPTTDRDSDPKERAVSTGLVGLAVSGGGIRSATFTLGILQALCARGLITAVDYLSTVSGGGYIGAWLESLLQKEAENTGQDMLPDVQRGLTPGAAGRDGEPEPGAVRFLRDYSNYLTPQAGMFSADTWTMAMIWLRNTVLNMIVIVSTACFVLLLPRLVGSWVVDQDDSVLIKAQLEFPLVERRTGLVSRHCWCLRFRLFSSAGTSSVLRTAPSASANGTRNSTPSCARLFCRHCWLRS